MNVKRMATIVTTGGGLAAWLVGATTSKHTVAPAPVVTRAPIESKGAELATEMARFREHMRPTVTPRQPGRNLFKFHAAPAHSAAPAAVAPPLVAPLVPGPLPVPPMRLSGISEDPSPSGPVRIAFINAAGQLYMAKEGDTVMQQYTVTKISSEVVELTDITDGTVRRLALR